MIPLIKWPGGKSREFSQFKDFIPQGIDTYIEPFFGGGGVFFKLEPRRAFVNDINKNLMLFYQLIKENGSSFKKILTQIADDWENINKIAEFVFENVKGHKGNLIEERLRKDIHRLGKRKNLPKLINGQSAYWGLLSDRLINKFNKIEKLESENGEFSNVDFYNQIVAVAKGAYYYYLRDGFIPRTVEHEAARFFFLREYCFGSMFRFNSDGGFNIPYGGATYNDKSFHDKVASCYSRQTIGLLKNTKIHSTDFRQFFKKLNNQIGNNSFCFFDPPYDTEFSEYDQEAFGKKDHADLADLFGKLKCKSLMIIKKTTFISDLYAEQSKQNSSINIKEYRKNYSYNVRGRNKRNTTHLLITNYQNQDEQREQEPLFAFSQI